ncbi:MAG: hypothetical protein QXN37_00175 [Candidatus Anstonellaceae archaeon]
MRKMCALKQDEPFSARYSLPAQISQNLGEVSWETVVQLSSDFQIKVEHKSQKLRKIIKELQMARLLLLEKIRARKDGKIPPRILVDVVKLLQKSEEVAQEYDVDLHQFSTFLYIIIEKLKKEKLEKYGGQSGIASMCPIKDELLALKEKGENRLPKKRKGRK